MLIRKIITAILGRKQEDGNFTGYVAKTSVQLFLIHCVALVLGFLSNYILVKVAGVNAYGAYVYIFNLLYLLVSFCIMGVDTLLVKKVAAYDATQKYAELKGIIFFSLIAVILGSLIVSFISQQVIGFTGMKSKMGISWLILSFLSLLMLSVTAVNQASLQGLKKIVFSQVTEKVIKPLVILIVVVIFFYIRKAVILEELIWINIAAIGTAMVITLILNQKSLASRIKKVKAQYDLANWASSSMTFFLLSILYVFNSRVDIFLLGLFRRPEEVGIYTIALRISEVIGFMLVIANFVMAPVIVKLFESGELVKLQKLVTRSSRAVLSVGLPLMLIIIVFRKNILLFFGEDLLDGQEALLVLCFGQFINVVFGSVGLLLVMTGHQKFSIFSLTAATGLNIILNLVLVPRYGLMGTAIATAMCLIVWNCMMYFFVRRKLNIRTTAFGI